MAEIGMYYIDNDFHFYLTLDTHPYSGSDLMPSSALNRRKLWTMSCEVLFQNFAASLTPDLIAKLCRRYQYPLPNANHSDLALYHLAHEHCHRDSPFSRQVQRYLNRRHAALVSQIAQLPPLAVRARVTEVLAEEQAQSSNLLPGMMWAVCSDPRQDVRPIEQFFIEELHLRCHCLLLAQFRDEPHSAADPAAANAEREALEQTLKRLETERDDLRQDVQNLQRANTRMNQDNARLQGDLDDMKRRGAELEKQRRSQAAQASQGVTLRDVRKLQHEVARLSAALREKDMETARLAAMVVSHESTPLPDGHPADEAISGEPPLPEPEWPVFDLNGKRVALIGGLTKASGHYEQTISELGGLCMRYEGSANQGHKKLARIIRQADVVFCPVDCVSHGTASAAKKLCRSLDKPCHFLRSSGISHLRQKLREVAAG